jgi:endonuclease I/fibronectin type 3 domain-containing protein
MTRRRLASPLPLFCRLGLFPRVSLALLALGTLLVGAFPGASRAGEPAGYYNAAEGLSGDALRTALRDIIDGHNSLSYNAAKDRLWDTVDNQGGFVQCIYTGRTSTNLNPDTNSMNAEHTWPQSRGAGSTPPRSDLHHLFVTDAEWNSRRGSLIFRTVPNPTATSPIGAKVNSSVGFEPPDETKGDVARACFYFHVRYNLPLNDSLAFLNGNDNNTADNYMAVLSDMLDWHDQDPPSSFETTRNDRVFTIQNNRNPFIDRPEFACLIFEPLLCIPDDEPPAVPAGLSALEQVGRVALDWTSNAEPDLAGYHVYRSTTAGVLGTRLTATPTPNSNYSDTQVQAPTTYFYSVTAIDLSGNESAPTDQVDAAPLPDTTAPNAPSSLVALSGDGRVTLNWNDNGEADLEGYLVYRALVSGGPYGPPLTAGLLASSDYIDLEVANGTTYFYVVAAVDFSANQSPFSPEVEATPEIDITPPATPAGLAATPGDGQVALDWNDNAEPDLLGYRIRRSTTSGGPYPLLDTGGLVGTSAYGDATVINGLAYYYIVSAVDATGNESEFSPEVAATPFDNIAPAAPGALTAIASEGAVDLNWPDNADADLVGYQVFRGRTSGGPYAPAHDGLLSASQYLDQNVFNGETYYYVVAAEDDASNRSAFGPQATASVGGGTGSGEPWMNEIHYDNDGTDSGEFVEIAGPAGMSLAGWSLVAYNGSNGAMYSTVALSGVFPSQQSCLGTLAFDLVGLQNGAPDGVALVNASGVVVQFLSYEGQFDATDGPASGQTSVDLGVSEIGTTPVGQSLQLIGTGSAAADFAWSGPAGATRGQPNAGQTFANGCAVQTDIPFGWKVR